MNIRLAELKDLNAVTEIYNQAILTKRCTADTEPFISEQRKPWLQEHLKPDYPLYVYEKDDKVVGYVYFTAYRPGRKAMRYIAELSYYIHNDYQRQGIGSEMMEFALLKAKAIGFRDLLAILLELNTPSIHLLEKFGFTKWGELPNIADFDGEVCSHLYYGLRLK